MTPREHAEVGSYVAQPIFVSAEKEQVWGLRDTARPHGIADNSFRLFNQQGHPINTW